LLVACSANPNAREQTSAQPDTRAAQSLINRAGFALDETPPADAPSAGTLTASFRAPVVVDDGSAPGTGSVTLDGTVAPVESLAVVEQVEEEGILYIILQNPQAPDRAVVVAARSIRVDAGTTLQLNNDDATALVVDGTTGEARLAVSGTFTVTQANLAVGGVVEASISANLVAVSLASWPQHLLPLTQDGEALERAAVAAAGSFVAPVGEDGAVTMGTANIPVTVDGIFSFTLVHAQFMPAARDLAENPLLILADADQSHLVLVEIPADALVAGADVALGTLTANAWIMDQQTQVVVAAGSLHVDGYVDGVELSGSVTLSADGYVFRCESGDCGGEEEPPPPSCGADTVQSLVEGFVADAAGILQDANAGFPPGYNAMIYLWDSARDGGMAVLVPDTVNLAAGGQWSLAPTEVEGRPLEIGMIYAGSCDGVVPVESGTITVQPTSGGRLVAQLEYTASGVTRSLGVDAALEPIAF